jgi:hypothetical protein
MALFAAMEKYGSSIHPGNFKGSKLKKEVNQVPILKKTGLMHPCSMFLDKIMCGST